MRNLNKIGLAAGLWLLALPAFATDLAILHNGFSVRHERRENLGAVTRLYLSADNSSYVDIATDQIVRFEKDMSPAAPAAAPVVPAAVSTAPVKPGSVPVSATAAAGCRSIRSASRRFVAGRRSERPKSIAVTGRSRLSPAALRFHIPGTRIGGPHVRPLRTARAR